MTNGVMKKVFCPQVGKEVWANQGGKDSKAKFFRCTQCGNQHDPK